MAYYIKFQSCGSLLQGELCSASTASQLSVTFPRISFVDKKYFKEILWENEHYEHGCCKNVFCSVKFLKNVEGIHFGGIQILVGKGE